MANNRTWLLDFRIEPGTIETIGHGSLRPLTRIVAASGPKGYPSFLPIGTSSQSAIGDALNTISVLWANAMAYVSTKGHGNVFERVEELHTVSEGYYQPYTTGVFFNDTLHGTLDTRPMIFPVPAGVQLDMLNAAQINATFWEGWPFLEYTGLTMDTVFTTPGSLDKYRFKWVELPQDPFVGSAIGAIAWLPRSAVDSTQEIIVCTLGAGWGSSILNASIGGADMESSIDISSLTNIERQHVLKTDEQQSGLDSTPASHLPVAEGMADDTTGAFFFPYLPQKPITVTAAWAEYLNPSIAGMNRTVIDNMMSTSPRPVPDALRESALLQGALISLLSNGLSNIGAASILQGDIRTIVDPQGRERFDGD
ncbi:hypothetical protein Q9189_007300 [Teloschistes chrysophthalmus]